MDEVLMKWFRSARAKNIPVSSVLLQEKAREGWLEKLRIRHNISFKQICGEEKSVNPNEITDWIIKLKSLLKGYDDKDIFNADETDLFYRALPDKTLCFKRAIVVVGKFQKSVSLFCCVATCWETWKLQLLFGKAKKPRCFKNIDVRKLSVSWKSNKKVWMTTDIMSDWLVELDKIKKQKRKSILFMSNATSHPGDLKLKNINLVLLPPNTTSMLQPLVQVIIRSFKVGCRKLLRRHALSQISSCKSIEELAKSVSVLDAISWTTSAFKKVEPGVEEYVKIEDDLSIEEENLHISIFLHRATTEALALSEDVDEESPMEDCKIKDYSEALKYSELFKQFFLNNEDSEGLEKLNPTKIHLEKQVCCVKKRNQT
ncbi:Tigger transposable element-derived protein 6 [Araneus ventricosus]|uniref:Tigger transposable element-derived protein 6 n=1 Tax=Araneus ventricosus TaxID=182803 RepID=A0A4Y2EC90_ARAVE|nr:Tigger transposable element-derived protein 6 [Araneus ventricosus]